MKRTDVIVIGAGQAGLAMSRCLSADSVDHVVLERGRVGERWLSERWSSLRLLSPNWQTRLPGYHYQGSDPDGFMSSSDFAEHLTGYARSYSAPLELETTVRSVRAADSGYRVATDRGDFAAASVVLATGYCDRPFVPAMARRLGPDVRQLSPSDYRGPEQLPEGGVLVVGASATGVQLADEIQRSGRPVTLAVGSHLRLPRRYRGRDILWWLERMGIFGETVDKVRDLDAARRAPSWQLVGRDDHRSLDLPTLQAQGVRLCGRLTDIEGSRLHFADDLPRSAQEAERKLWRLLARIDAFAAVSGMAEQIEVDDGPGRFRAPQGPTRLNLRNAGIRSVVWATGYRRSYPWLQVRGALDPAGELHHHKGVMEPGGLYALGLRFQRRRSSSFIDGVGDDAVELSEHLTTWLRQRQSRAA